MINLLFSTLIKTITKHSLLFSLPISSLSMKYTDPKDLHSIVIEEKESSSDIEEPPVSPTTYAECSAFQTVQSEPVSTMIFKRINQPTAKKPQNTWNKHGSKR